MRRDTLEKSMVKIDGLAQTIRQMLEDIQDNLFNRSKKFRDENITDVDNFDQFQEVLNQKGGFIRAYWDGTTETEEKIKEITKATIRCIPLDSNNEEGTCVFSKKKATQRALFAIAY